MKTSCFQRKKFSVLILGLFFVAGCSENTAQNDGTMPVTHPRVGIFTVESSDLTIKSLLPGRASASRIAEIRPQVSGIVKSRLFEEGAFLKKGQQLYQIDSRPFEAEVAKTQAEFETAGKLLARLERLVKAKAASQNQLDEAYSTYKAAKAALDIASVNLQHTYIEAPISGFVGRSLITEGALVVTGQAQVMTTVTQLDPINIDLNLPVTKMLDMQQALSSGSLAKAESSNNVRITLENGHPHPVNGHLKLSDVLVDRANGSVTLRAEVANPSGTILPGMFVRAEVVHGEVNNGLLVPQQAVVRDHDGKAAVWSIDSNDKARFTPIVTTRTIGNMWLVESGVSEGARVVTEGFHNLRDGIVVEPVKANNVKVVTAFATQIGTSEKEGE